MNKVYQKYNFCRSSLKMADATICFIIFHWKPEISLAVVVAPTLGCAGSEQVKCVDLQTLLALLGKTVIETSADWKHCSCYALLTRKPWLQ